MKNIFPHKQVRRVPAKPDAKGFAGFYVWHNGSMSTGTAYGCAAEYIDHCGNRFPEEEAG